MSAIADTETDRERARAVRIDLLQGLVRAIVGTLTPADALVIANRLSELPDGDQLVAELVLAVDPDRVML